MAVPKKKPSQTRRRHRRSSWAAKFKKAGLIECENCGQPKFPHRVCRNCGQYRGKQVVDPRTKIRRL